MAQRRKQYTLTPEKFLNRDERRQLMKTCRERAELDLLQGRKTWVVRYMLVDLALFSGLRVSEIAALTIKDIKLSPLHNAYLIVRNGKGSQTRTVYLDEPLAKHLKQFIDYKRKTLRESTEPDAPLFAGRDGGHSKLITLQKSFKKATETAGLRRDISIHSARHTYATFLLQDTGNLQYVKQQLGHTNIAMTSHYARILPEQNGKLANMIQRDI